MNIINQQRPNSENFAQFRNGLGTYSGGYGTTTGPGPGNVPPPRPPRVSHQVQNYQSYGSNYGGSYGMQGGYGFGGAWNYRNSMAGSYSPYGSYGGYSQMFPSSYSALTGGPSGDVENRFIQFAEESSRPAFQSVESVVRTFSSVAMLLESTHYAMTSSFRAILAVAENIGKTRNMFGEVMSAFALIRFFKWLYRKITFVLGLNPDDPNAEQIWRKTAADALNGDGKGVTSSWPIFMFLSLLFAIPYILNKLMNSVRQTTTNAINDPRRWLVHGEPVYSAIVLYDFDPINRDELSIKSGQKIWLAPQSLQPKDMPGWSRASDSRGGVGFVPTNYVKIVGQLEKKCNDSTDEQSSSLSLTQPSQPPHSPDSIFNDKVSDTSKESMPILPNLDESSGP